MKRIGMLLMLCAAACSHEKERVRSAADATAEAKTGKMKSGGQDADKPQDGANGGATSADAARAKQDAAAGVKQGAQDAAAGVKQGAQDAAAGAKQTAVDAKESVGSAVSGAKDKAQDVAASAKDKAQDAASGVKQAAQDAAASAKDAAAGAKDKAQAAVDSAKRKPGGDQGPRIVALPPNDKSIVNVQLAFRSGAIDDPQGKAGITNLAARVMAEGGTESLDSKQLLNALFPLAAEVRVRVDKEETTFFARVHKDNLEKLLPILQDVLLHPRWDPKEFARLREEVVNDVEKRLRQGDDENLGKESLAELMFRGHPYGRLSLGHARDLRSITLDELKAHAARVFTSDRLTVGVSGSYADALPGELAKALSALPKSVAVQPEVPAQKPHGPRFLLVEKNADSTAISIGVPFGLKRTDADWPAMSVARTTFGEHRQFNGRLMMRLREERGLNYGDYAYIEHFQQEGGDAATAQTGRPRQQQTFTIWLRPVQSENALFALRAALYELGRTLGDEPFTKAEIEQNKGFLDGYILMFDQTDERKLGYALDDAFHGTKDFLGSWRSSLKDVTAERANAAWKKWIDPSQLEIVLVGKNMDAVKKAILDGSASPMHYPPGQQKPAELLEKDKLVEKFPLGAKGDADVEVVPVEKMFE